MADKIANDLYHFNRDIASFSDALTRLREQKKQLEEDLQALHGMWQGDAHSAFVSRAAADLNEVDDLIRGFEELQKNLTDARDEYTDCEKDISSMIDFIRF